MVAEIFHPLLSLIASACMELWQAAMADLWRGWPGVSFLPTLLGQSQPEAKRDLCFVRREGGLQYRGLQYNGKTIEAFRRSDWKLVLNSAFAPLELYKLQRDPAETTDLAAKEKAIVRDLSAALRQHIQRGGSVPWQPPQSQVTTPEK